MLVAPSSSSTKKAAKLAKSGQGKKVRFQGGTTFPLIVAIVVVLGLALVVYARQSRPAADASPPTIDDHWHQAYGFYLCDTWVQLTGNKEDPAAPGFDEFQRTGIHSHDDGVIHWHPFTSASVGTRAKLSLFLDVYGVELDNDKLVFPEDQRSQLAEPYQADGIFEEGETQCTVDGKEEDAELKVVVWNNFSDTDDGTTYIADFDNIRRRPGRDGVLDRLRPGRTPPSACRRGRRTCPSWRAPTTGRWCRRPARSPERPPSR